MIGVHLEGLLKEGLGRSRGALAGIHGPERGRHPDVGWREVMRLHQALARFPELALLEPDDPQRTR